MAKYELQASYGDAENGMIESDTGPFQVARREAEPGARDCIGSGGRTARKHAPMRA